VAVDRFRRRTPLPPAPGRREVATAVAEQIEPIVVAVEPDRRPVIGGAAFEQRLIDVVRATRLMKACGMSGSRPLPAMETTTPRDWPSIATRLRSTNGCAFRTGVMAERT